ncbi:hypothetical protein ABPG72_000835 [Tetrahymena utriculariae]
MQEQQYKSSNSQSQQDLAVKQQTNNIQAQQQQQYSKAQDHNSNVQNINMPAQKQVCYTSQDDKIKIQLELMEKLKDLEGEIEQMEQEEEKAQQNDQNQENKNYKSKKKPLQSNASSQEYVKRIKELEKERKSLKQRREEKILQYETALQEQLQKQKEEEIINKQKMKQMKKMESEKKLAEIEKRKKEREEKQREEKQKIHDIKQQKPLYVNLAEKFSVQQDQELEEKKKQLATLREISKPIDFNEIKQHQEQYDQKKKYKESSLPRNNNEWSYYKPSFKSKIFEIYNNDLEHSKNNSEFKQKNAQQIVERRKVFSQIIKENFQPKQDPKKEQEAKEIQQKIHTQPRNQKNVDVMKAEGNEYLRNSIEKVKALKNSNSQSDKLSFREHRDQYRLNKNQQLSPSKLKSIQSSIQFDDHSLSNLNISQISQNKKRQMSYHNQGSSNQQNTNRGNEEINYGSNIFFKIQEDVNNNKRSFETVDEKKKFFDYVQREYRKKLGTKYMESARYQNSHPQNLEDHIKEEVDKELYKQKNPIEQKIQIVQNILKPYEEKAERDHRLLGIQQNDQQARSNVADTYLSSIKAKLALINEIQTESYEALKQQKANQIVLKVDNKSKRVSRKRKKASYFDAEKVNNIYAPSPKRNGSISPNIRIKTNQNQQFEYFSEYSPIKYTPQQTNRQIAQTKSAHKIMLNEFQINIDEKQSERIIENQLDKNNNNKNNQSQYNSYSSQKQIPAQNNRNQNEKNSIQIQIQNSGNNQNTQKQEKAQTNAFNNNNYQVQSPSKNQQHQNTKNNQQAFSNQVSQQNQVVVNHQSQDINIIPTNQENSPIIQKSKNSQSNLSSAEREYLSKQQMQNNIKKNILILEKIQSGQNVNTQQQQQSEQQKQKISQNDQNLSNQPNNQQKTDNNQLANKRNIQINNNQNITQQKVVNNSSIQDSNKKESQIPQNTINYGSNNQSSQKNQQIIKQTQQSKVNHIQINNDLSEYADQNYQSENANKKNNKLININEFEQQKQLQNQNIKNVDQNVLKKQFFSIQIQYLTNIKEKNPITYHIQIVDKNTVVKDLDGLNIDIEPLDLIVPEEKQNIAIINDTLEVNYDPKKMLKHYANRLSDIYVVIRIIQEKNQNEELIGWIASPLFQDNQFNYGVFKEQLYLPPDIFKLPLEKSKYQQSYLTIQFKIFEGKL